MSQKRAVHQNVANYVKICKNMTFGIFDFFFFEELVLKKKFLKLKIFHTIIVL